MQALILFLLRCYKRLISPLLPSAWPQAYSVQRNQAAGLLTLSTPYYTVQHDMKRGGAISSIRLARTSK